MDTNAASHTSGGTVLAKCWHWTTRRHHPYPTKTNPSAGTEGPEAARWCELRLGLAEGTLDGRARSKGLALGIC